jgi:YVTN family beta-propeller protein
VGIRQLGNRPHRSGHKRNRRVDPVAQNVGGGGPSPTAIVVGDGAVWVANRFVASEGVSPSGKRGTVSRIDPRTSAVVATIPVGHEPFGIAASDASVWVANRTDSRFRGSTLERTES